MLIIATDPATVPARDAVDYPVLMTDLFKAERDDLSQALSGLVRLWRVRMLPDQTVEKHPTRPPILIDVPNLTAKAMDGTPAGIKVAIALQAVTEAIAALAIEAGEASGVEP